VVDYKSDRIGAGGAEAHAARYELQMMIYLHAAGRHLAGVGGSVADATLYFLRAGSTHRFTAAGRAAARLERRLGELAEELTRCRRAGRFPRRDDRLCSACPHAKLCLRADRS
jgi:hypothetical protein